MFSTISPVSSLHARRGGETGEISSAAPVSFPPWPPNLRLEKWGGFLCCRCGCVGGLRTASARTAFAISGGLFDR